MIRQELIDKLSIVKPALSSNDMIPELTDYWFTGTRLMAYNDKISIAVPYKSEFVGALPGTVMLALLNSSSAKEVNFTDETEKEVTLKVGRAKIKLGVRDFKGIFTMPKLSDIEAKPRLSNETTVKLWKGVERCLQSIGDDPSSPDKLGVTLIPEIDGVLLMFSTDSTTITHSSLKIGKGELKARTILSGIFCKEMVELAKKAKPETIAMEITANHALFVAGGVTLFGKLLASDHPYDFPSILNHHCPPGYAKRSVQIPARLPEALESAAIILDDGSGDNKTTAEISGGMMRLRSQSKRGEVDSGTIALDGHSDIKVRFNPKLVKAGCEHFDQVLFSKECVVMTSKGSNDIYLIAAS